MHKVSIKMRSIPKCNVLYKPFQGDYLKIQDAYAEINKLVTEELKLAEFETSFGVFFDEPEFLENETEARAIIGLVVPETRTVDIEIMVKNGFKYAELDETKAMHGSMPNDEYFFYVLKSMEFQPVFDGDQAQLYEGFKSYQKIKNAGKGC